MTTTNATPTFNSLDTHDAIEFDGQRIIWASKLRIAAWLADAAKVVETTTHVGAYCWLAIYAGRMTEMKREELMDAETSIDDVRAEFGGIASALYARITAHVKHQDGFEGDDGTDCASCATCGAEGVEDDAACETCLDFGGGR